MSAHKPLRSRNKSNFEPEYQYLSDFTNRNRMSFASNNPFNPPPYESGYKHDTEQPTEESHLAPPEIDYDAKMRSHSPVPPATPRRGSHESSPAGSMYSATSTLCDTASMSTVEILEFFHTNSHFNLRIHDPGQNNDCIYYVEHSAFTPNKPDIMLFQGGDKQGCPIVGVARWSSMWSKEVQVGLGDAGTKNQNAASIPWETMRSTSVIKQNEHRWKLSSDPKGNEYIWKRTHHVGVESEHNSWSACNLKFLDAHTNELLATFATNRFKSWKKFGKFTFMVNLGEEWQLMSLLTCLALVEKSRRRSRAERSCAGGGGGGGGGG